MKRILFQVLFIVISLASYSQDNINPADTGYWYVDEQASFQGGDINTFNSWVKEQVNYPNIAVEEAVFSKQIIQFSVDSAGGICEIKVIKSIHPLIDEEFFRVLNSSPKWIPAKIKGKTVKQNFVVPISINLK